MEVTLAKGDVLFSQGDSSSSTLFIVDQGKLKAEKFLNDKMVECGVLTPGDIFGEISMILGDKRSATITALEDNTVVKNLTKDEFLEMVAEDPELAWKLLTKLANKTKLLDEVQHLFMNLQF